MRKRNCNFLNIAFIILLQLIAIGYCTAQNENSASILEQLKKNTNPNDRFVLLYDLSYSYRDTDSSKSYQYAYEALTLAKQHNSLSQQAIIYENLAGLAEKLKQAPKQVLYADSSYFFATASGKEGALAYANYAIAYKYNAIGENEKFVSHMLEALSYFEKKKTKYRKLVSGYENLAAQFSQQENIAMQKKYTDKAVSIAYESKDEINIANALTTYALYLEALATEKADSDKSLLDSAEVYYLKAIKIFEKNITNETIQFNHARTCANLSYLYLYHFFETRPLQTLVYLKKTESVCLASKNPKLMMITYGQQTQFHTYNKDVPQIEKALANVEAAIKMQTKVEPYYFAVLYKNYMDLATLKQDFTSYRKYFDLYDSVLTVKFNTENNTRDFNASVRFETEKKNKEIEVLKASNKAKRKINYLFITLFALGLLTILFMFRSYYFRQKALIKAKEEANLKAKLKEEENISIMLEAELANQERLVVIQDKILTEQQKDRLQQELMTNSLQLERKNEILNELRLQLSQLKLTEQQAQVKRISKTLNKSLELDEEFELLKTSLENTNPIFFASLQKKAADSLTKLDLKYCGYIKLGMGSREIANLMNIEAKSMHMARYRIKQKLNLDKDQDLDSFIIAL
jgi:DNA-binding CsgD family transcriptional regulator